MYSLLLWILTIALFGLGLIGVFIPALPGVALVFAGVLFYAAVTGFEVVSVTSVTVFGVVAVLAWLVEYVGALIGLKLGGGGKYSFFGMVVGGVAGLVIGGPPGLIIGVFLGAMLGALNEGKTVDKAGRAALFSLVGLFGAKIIQLTLAVSMIIAFLIIIVF